MATALLVFERLLPGELIRDAGVTTQSDAERLRLYSTEDFQVVTETGRKLRAEVQLLEPRNRIDRRREPQRRDGPGPGAAWPVGRGHQRRPAAPLDAPLQHSGTP